MYQNGEFICQDLKLAENPAVLGLLVIDAQGTKGSGDADIFFYFPQRYKEIFLTDDGTIYIDSALKTKPVGLVSGTVTNENKIPYIAEYVTLPDKYYWYIVPLSILDFMSSNISLQNVNIEIINSQISINGQENKKLKETILDNAKKIIDIVKRLFSSENQFL